MWRPFGCLKMEILCFHFPLSNPQTQTDIQGPHIQDTLLFCLHSPPHPHPKQPLLICLFSTYLSFDLNLAMTIKSISSILQDRTRAAKYYNPSLPLEYTGVSLKRYNFRGCCSGRRGDTQGCIEGHWPLLLEQLFWSLTPEKQAFFYFFPFYSECLVFWFLEVKNNILI